MRQLKRYLHPRPLREFHVRVSEYADVAVLATSPGQARWIGFVAWWFGMTERDRGGRTMSSVWGQILHDVSSRHHVPFTDSDDGTSRWPHPIRVPPYVRVDNIWWQPRADVPRRLGFGTHHHECGRYFVPFLGAVRTRTASGKHRMVSVDPYTSMEYRL